MKVLEIAGGIHKDERGTLSFVNDFNFESVKRFYSIYHAETSAIRAWQGHKIEHKYFFVNQGSFVVSWVQPDNWDQPSKSLQPAYTILDAERPVILSVPAGFANGIKALKPQSLLTIYSNLNIKDSAADMWRFPAEQWLDWTKFK